ncbi:hypothetical protein O9Z70_08665 [Devosia sp. YIM 151766]|uniref:hypothetical protein n=1 Tax=Devosia sp. YIM 151766 TaxID=3017325 RepID=UPI00255C79BA|nr:hypothetical protein [Devosia sp. YIM 151766]WIY51562.1 hypothetical protein O9Z70_08665 [Devosia sp. YIM 151766]
MTRDLAPLRYLQRLPIRRASTFLVASTIAQGLTALAGLMIAHWTSIADYGLYTIVTTLMGAIIILTSGGAQLSFTAILGRTWPAMDRAAEAQEAVMRMRRRLAPIMLPPVLGAAFALLLHNGAALETAICLCVFLLMFWWADLHGRLAEQVLYFARRTSRVQAVEIGLAALRILAVLALHALGMLDIYWAVGLSVLVALLKVGPMVNWSRQIIGRERGWREEDRREVRLAVRQQLPVDLYHVFQAQIVIVALSLFAGVSDVAGLGAIGRIQQLLLPVDAFTYAFCVPIFAQATRNLLRKYWALVMLTMAPALLLLGVAYLAPWILLALVGPNYAGLDFEILVAAAVALANRGSLTAWRLVAHRGWTGYSWLQIPVGLGTCVLIALVVDIGTIAGALTLTLSLTLGRLAAAGAELIAAHRRGALMPRAAGGWP